MSTVSLEELKEKTYKVKCGETEVELRPIKVWILKPVGRRGVVIGLFKCPDGSTARKAIAKVDEEGNIIG